jgi:hypothetical protein
MARANGFIWDCSTSRVKRSSDAAYAVSAIGR